MYVHKIREFYHIFKIRKNSLLVLTVELLTTELLVVK